MTPTRTWTYGRHPYLAGAVRSMRVDAEALGLAPLAVRAQGVWAPATDDGDVAREPVAAWAELVVARGERAAFEMEQVLPGADPDDPDSDPIMEAIELGDAGDRAGARDLLMRLLAQDLRCLDAHAHLGNLELDLRPAKALLHYAVGRSIGALSLGRTFDGVLPYGLVDNRPFLRCLYGVGLASWRLGELREAAAAFRQMLRLDPDDDQGAGFDLAAVEAGRRWDDRWGDPR